MDVVSPHTSLISFLTGVFIISLSGVMAPGPITTVVVGEGNRSPHAGALVAIGHAVVELPLMAAIFFGLGYLISIEAVKLSITILGGAFLFMMGIGMLKSVSKGGDSEVKSNKSPFVSGILLSVGNPYFIIWWATVGASLIVSSTSFGVKAFILLCIIHWLCDLAWLYFLSALSFKGGHFFGRNFQKVIFVVCGVFLLYFSTTYLIAGAKTIHKLIQG